MNISKARQYDCRTGRNCTQDAAAKLFFLCVHSNNGYVVVAVIVDATYKTTRYAVPLCCSDTEYLFRSLKGQPGNAKSGPLYEDMAF